MPSSSEEQVPIVKVTTTKVSSKSKKIKNKTKKKEIAKEAITSDIVDTATVVNSEVVDNTQIHAMATISSLNSSSINNNTNNSSTQRIIRNTSKDSKDRKINTNEVNTSITNINSEIQKETAVNTLIPSNSVNASNSLNQPENLIKSKNTKNIKFTSNSTKKAKSNSKSIKKVPNFNSHKEILKDDYDLRRGLRVIKPNLKFGAQKAPNYPNRNTDASLITQQRYDEIIEQDLYPKKKRVKNPDDNKEDIEVNKENKEIEKETKPINLSINQNPIEKSEKVVITEEKKPKPIIETNTSIKENENINHINKEKKNKSSSKNKKSSKKSKKSKSKVKKIPSGKIIYNDIEHETELTEISVKKPHKHPNQYTYVNKKSKSSRVQESKTGITSSFKVNQFTESDFMGKINVI